MAVSAGVSGPRRRRQQATTWRFCSVGACFIVIKAPTSETPVAAPPFELARTAAGYRGQPTGMIPVTCQRSTRPVFFARRRGPRPLLPAPQGPGVAAGEFSDCRNTGRTKAPLRRPWRRREQHRILLQRRRRFCQVLRSSAQQALCSLPLLSSFCPPPLPTLSFSSLLSRPGWFALESISERAVGFQECRPHLLSSNRWRMEGGKTKEGKLLRTGESG